MLGAARASEYAAWWGSGPARFVSTSTTPVTTASTFADFGSFVANGFSAPGATRSFDNTSMGSATQGIQAMTVRWQNDSNYPFVTNQFRTSFQIIGPSASQTYPFGAVAYKTPTIDTNWLLAPARTVTGSYISFLSAFGSFEFVTPTPLRTWNSLADRWVTIVTCYADSNTVFANWSGGTQSGYWYQRMVLQDAQTGELLGTNDTRYNPFNNPITGWNSLTWSWNTSTPTAGNGHASVFHSTANFGSGNIFTPDKMLTAAHWQCQGTTWDPLATVDSVPLRYYFVGQCWPETVNGARAWFNWSARDSAVSGFNTDLTLALAGRASQTTNLIMSAVTSGLTTPVFDSANP